MKGEHYHYYVSYTGGDFAYLTSRKEINTLAGIQKLFLTDRRVLRFSEIKCDCPPEPEDAHVSDVLEAIAERNKAREMKRIISGE